MQQALTTAPEFTGSTLRAIDPATGFLIPGTPEDTSKDRDAKGRWLNGHNGFAIESIYTPEKKLQFLKLYKELFPDFASCLQVIDVSVATHRNHLAVDEAFRQAVEEIQSSHLCQINKVRFDTAKTRAGAYDRDRLLYGYMPEVYNPKQTIEIKHTLTPQEASATHKRMEQAIDAEVIGAILRRNDMEKIPLNDAQIEKLGYRYALFLKTTKPTPCNPWSVTTLSDRSYKRMLIRDLRKAGKN